MTIGRTLWAIIIIKLIVMFAVLRLLFFPNFLNERFTTHEQKSNYVGGELIERGVEIEQ